MVTATAPPAQPFPPPPTAQPFVAPPVPAPPPQTFVAPVVATPPPQPPQPQCGVAPDFFPCVGHAQASEALLRCCQAKNLPPGCQRLCRYDITQQEVFLKLFDPNLEKVKAAMDAGQCGILSVAPYLECAAQGRDNRECCRYRGIMQKRCDFPRLDVQSLSAGHNVKSFAILLADSVH